MVILFVKSHYNWNRGMKISYNVQTLDSQGFDMPVAATLQSCPQRHCYSFSFEGNLATYITSRFLCRNITRALFRFLVDFYRLCYFLHLRTNIMGN
jgi:hypothetical protein